MERFTKQAVWREALGERAECPRCHKSVTLRTLRWRHKCRARRAAPRAVVLSEEMAARRKQAIQQRAIEQLMKRLDGAPQADEGADPGGVSGA